MDGGPTRNPWREKREAAPCRDATLPEVRMANDELQPHLKPLRTARGEEEDSPLPGRRAVTFAGGEILD